MRQTLNPSNPAEIGRRLRMLRLALGYTQGAMARMIGAKGVNPAQLWNNYEAGTRRISIDAAIALCLTAGTTMDWIYFGKIETLSRSARERIEIAMGAQSRRLQQRCSHDPQI